MYGHTSTFGSHTHFGTPRLSSLPVSIPSRSFNRKNGKGGRKKSGKEGRKEERREGGKKGKKEGKKTEGRKEGEKEANFYRRGRYLLLTHK